MPGARLVVLPGVGHVPQFEVPEDARRRVQAFLDAV
jgi:pimeloyl-ACP methyl ester carboxylesterase